MDRKGNVKWILFVLLVIAMIGCTDKESYINGMWRQETAETKWYSFDFMSDHTGVSVWQQTKEKKWLLINPNTNFRWTLLEDGRVKIEFEREDANAIPVTCKLENGKLVCKRSGMPTLVFTKERN